LSYWLGYTSFSSSHHSKEKIRDPLPLLISFSSSKNTEIIERRLQQIDWKCGKNRGRKGIGAEEVVQHGN